MFTKNSLPIAQAFTRYCPFSITPTTPHNSNTPAIFMVLKFTFISLGTNTIILHSQTFTDTSLISPSTFHSHVAFHSLFIYWAIYSHIMYSSPFISYNPIPTPSMSIRPNFGEAIIAHPSSFFPGPHHS